MKIIPLTKGFICLVDDCDYERLSEHSWSLMDTSKSFYAVTSIGNKTAYMHRIILNTPEGVSVDHVNGTHVENVLDNTCMNLRHASVALNNRNRNFTGMTGVCFDKRSGKWLARAMVNLKRVRLGLFADRNEAFQVLQNWKNQIGFRDSETPTMKGQP